MGILHARQTLAPTQHRLSAGPAPERALPHSEPVSALAAGAAQTGISFSSTTSRWKPLVFASVSPRVTRSVRA